METDKDELCEFIKGLLYDRPHFDEKSSILIKMSFAEGSINVVHVSFGSASHNKVVHNAVPYKYLRQIDDPRRLGASVIRNLVSRHEEIFG